MNLIENNPFRILGVISNATAKEILEAQTFLERYLEVGKSADLKFDMTPPLKTLNRSKEIISNAKNKIHSDFDKFSHSIFWFVNGSSIDKIALKKLSDTKDLKSASETFKKGSRDFTISKNTFSSIINYSTLEILSFLQEKNDERLINALKLKFDVINDLKIFKLLENLVTSASGKTNHKDFIKRYVDSVRVLLNELLPKKNQNKLLSKIFSHDKSIIGDINETMINSLLESINDSIFPLKEFIAKQRLKTDSQIISSKSAIIKRLKSVITLTKSDFNELLKLTSNNDFRFTNKLNELYETVNAALVMLFNLEQQKVIDAAQYSMNSTINSISFAAYIKVLKEAKESLSSVDCAIKSNISRNLEVISSVNSQLLELKRKINDSYGSYSSGGSSSESSSENEGCLVIGFVIFIIYCIVMANS